MSIIDALIIVNPMKPDYPPIWQQPELRNFAKQLWGISMSRHQSGGAPITRRTAKGAGRDGAMSRSVVPAGVLCELPRISALCGFSLRRPQRGSLPSCGSPEAGRRPWSPCEPWAVLIEALTPGHDHPPRHQHRRVLADLRLHSGQTIIWHNGQTTGYAAFLGLNLQHHKAVVVCSDVARVTDNLGNQLLT
jgi:hypothetical protein